MYVIDVLLFFCVIASIFFCIIQLTIDRHTVLAWLLVELDHTGVPLFASNCYFYILTHEAK